MKSLFIKIMQLATIIVIVATYSSAQEQAIALSSNPKTENPEAIKNLMQFIGRWDAEVKLISNGKENKLSYWVEGKMVANGSALYVDEGFSHPQIGSMIGVNLAGWDPYDYKIKWFSIDNMGTTHLHTGNWISPDHLQMIYISSREGKYYTETIDFNFNGPTSLIFQLIGTLDGVEFERAEGRFEKKTVLDSPKKPPLPTPQKTRPAPPAKKPIPVKK